MPNAFSNFFGKIKSIFSKIKLPSLKSMHFKDIGKKIIELPVKLWRRRVLFFIVVGIVAFLVALPFIIGGDKTVETTITEGTGTVQNLVVSIPISAFPYEKSFKVRVASKALSAQILSSGDFVSEIYELIPSDGRYNMATLPINVKYYFPSNLVGSNDSNAIAFASISSDGKVHSIIPGSSIGKDDKGYYVEANFFVVPKLIGVVSTPGQVLQTGIRLAYDFTSAKPALLIVPGSDANFSGYFTSAKITGISLWQSVFSDRSIYVYEYPLTKTRSFNYTEALRKFKEANPVPSEIIFESERLAQELIQHKETQFDILTHEIGGLIVYYCLSTHPEIKNVRKVAYVSVPFYGTNVADPRLATNIYDSKPDAAGTLYNLPDSMMLNLQSYLKSYIEAVNDYYDDILSNSEFLNKLKYLPYRTDVNVMAYMGNMPPLSIDLSSSLLERLYPEMVLNTGDGVVSRTASRLPYMTLKIFNGSWNNFYSTDQFIQEIKTFFNYEIPEVPTYKDDTFTESVKSDAEKVFESFMTSGSAEQFHVQEWKIDDNPHITFIQSYRYPGTQIAVYGNVVYTADSNGLYVGGVKVWEESINNLKETVDGISYGTQTKTFYRKLADTTSYTQVPADDYLATKDFAIFAKPRANNYVDFIDENGNLIVSLSGIYGSVIYDGSEIIFLTNRELYRYYYGIKYTAPIGLNQTYDMTYAIVIDDYVLAVTRAYGLLLFDRTGKYAYTGEGWIGNLGMYKSGKYVVAVGDGFITLIDFENRSIDRIVESVSGTVYDAAVWENNLYLMTSNGVLVYKIG
ncbi:MAG TPA: hypothetical protein PKW84_03370 [Fervidobacterium sp.]|nr:hypothetical protein [Fervidobacterium sp.]HQO05147.1 hypothetical protein [Fervidobacterium sp.]HQQ17632.1 hypothetical protein [Fervidobacterium sp.]